MQGILLYQVTEEIPKLQKLEHFLNTKRLVKVEMS